VLQKGQKGEPFCTMFPQLGQFMGSSCARMFFGIRICRFALPDTAGQKWAQKSI
jgi:hypothetical protein